MFDYIEIDGVKYISYSVEKVVFGGRISKKEAIVELKNRGIKYNLSRAYTPYVGHWAILIEKKFEKVADELFYGN